MWYLQTPRTAKKEGAWGSAKVRGSRGVKHFPWSHRALGSVRQPTQALLLQPEWPPLSAPAPSLLLICVVLEVDGPGVADETPLAGTAGGGWEYPPTHTPPPNPGHPSRGCCGPQRINGAEATHFLWPGDRLHHTAPHCRLPLSREVPPAPSGEGSWAPMPPASPFRLLEAGELGRAGILQVSFCLPPAPENRRSLDLAGRPGGSAEDRALQGLGLNWVSEEGSRGVKDELEGVRLEAGKGGGGGGREPGHTQGPAV